MTSSRAAHPDWSVVTLALWLGALGIHWAWMLQAEWAIDAQYSYGYLVPLCAAYLLYLRWPERPALAPRPHPGLTAGLLVLGSLVFIPLGVIRGANPEWRAAFWVEGLLILGLSLLTLWRAAGWGWVRHFGPVLALLLIAIPWPREWENLLVNGLMRGVAAVVVEIMNLLGHHARQMGNLVILREGVIGVEEACSGVRSLQSTLMAALVCALLFRWRWWAGGGLVLIGAVLSLGLNVLRTLVLTLVTVEDGTDAAHAWHDPLGLVVAIGSVAALLGICLALERLKRPASAQTPHRAALPHPRLAPGLGLALILPLVLAPVITHFWYARAQPTAAVAARFAPPPEAEAREIPERVRALLRYREGSHHVWWGADGTRYTLFFFYWDEGTTSSHAGVHRPDVCLPSAGYQLRETEPDFLWRREPVPVAFESLRFALGERPLWVYFAVWDEVPGEQVPLASNWQERLGNVWRQERVRGRYSVELIVEPTRPMSPGAVQQAARRALDAHLQLIPPAEAASGS